jgi:uncharacterized phage protein gp47/JayE
VAGVDGNVAAVTVTATVVSLSGVTVVTNPNPTTDGADEESDTALLARYLYRVQHPSSGGNVADYTNWASEVSGVGSVAVLPLDDGPGTVGIYLLGTDLAPAIQSVVDAVLNYIAPGWTHVVEAEDMTLSGYGASIDDTLSDDTGDSVKMVYVADGDGLITGAGIEDLLDQPGIWKAKIRLKVDDTAGTANLLTIGIWNTSAATWAFTRPEGTIPATTTLQANDLATEFAEAVQDFAWNGVDELELRIYRETTDTATIAWIDQVTYQSAFSADTGGGKAPIGARVTVASATPVPIGVTATLTIASGYDEPSVIVNAVLNVYNYFKSSAANFGTSRLIYYTYVGSVILATPGVSDYADLLVNAGAANITIAAEEVAVPGEVSFST